MYFYHPFDFNQHQPARDSMYGGASYSHSNTSPKTGQAYWNGYSNPLTYQRMTRPTVQNPTQPANQQNLQRGQNQGGNTQYQYPPVDETLIHQSANETRKLMADARMVLDKFATSNDFNRRLMELAQQSKTDEVKRLIGTIGVKSNVEVSFNPDGLRLVFSSKIENTKCCQLEISLRWR